MKELLAHDFKGEEGLGVYVHRLEDGAKGAFANLAHEGEVFRVFELGRVDFGHALVRLHPFKSVSPGHLDLLAGLQIQERSFWDSLKRR